MAPKESNVTASVAGAAVVILLASCTGGKYVEDYEVEPPKSDETFLWPDQVTAGNESDFAPDLSPNGAFVVYSSDKKGNKDIWEKRSSGGFARPVTLHSADDYQAVISPSGDKLAFISRREDAAGDVHLVELGLSFGGLLASEGDVSIISSRLTEDTNPSWFPDGEKIVFAARKPGEATPAIMMAETGDLKALPVGEARGDQPSVSPDGKRIVFVRAGAIFIYSFEGDKIEQITDGGALQDGQPRFSPAGDAVFFIRHADDTNDDGKLNGDDRPTLWRVDLATQKDQKMRENYALQPLTSAMFAAYSPQIRAPYLYMALQTEEGLDIFRFPDFGQVKVGQDLDAVKRQFDEQADYHDKTLVLRAAEQAFAKRGKDELAAEVVLLELDWLAQNARRTEAQWVHSKAKANFAARAEIVALADIALVALDLDPLAYPKFKDDPTAQQAAALQKLSERADQIVAPFNAGTDPAARRVRGRAGLIKAKILAAQRKFFDANDLLAKTVEVYADDATLAADAAHYAALIKPATSDVPSALRAFIEVVRNYPENRNVARRCALDATEMLNALENKVEALVEFRTNAKGLPILPAEAHMRISEHFTLQGKDAVAANELRQIVDLYPESPEVVLVAAAKLSALEERSGRYDEMEKALERLKQRFAGARPEHQKAARNLLTEFLVRRGEALMKQHDPEAAIKQYEKVIAIDALNVSAHRGLIDASARKNTLEPLLEKYEKEADDNPTSAERQYFYGYALTYNIDEAKSPRVKLGEIDDCIDVIENARQINGQILQIHQTLGWLYLQKGYWQQQYFDSGAVLATLRQKTGMVQDFIGFGDPNWLELGIDSFQIAYFLADYDTIERASLAQNLGQTFYELKNFQKSLSYYMQRIKLLPIIPMRDARAEGILWRRAGRSAFQNDEFELAETLQRMALTQWEKVADDGEIAYSLDALALTLRERGQCKEAVQIYERLERTNERLGRRGNRLGSKTNTGFCLYTMGQYQAALERFEDAELLLAEIEAGDEEEEIEPKAGEGAIQVDLGGQGSASKGFDLFARKNLIVTFKAKIYERMERHDLALAMYERKLKMLEAHREELIDDKDAPEKVLADEIAITQNNIGEMRLAAGYHLGARDAFAAARDTAKRMRPENQVYMSPSEVLNEVNRLRVHLRLADLGMLTPDEISGAAQDIERSTSELRPVYLQGSKSEGKPLAQLLALAASFNGRSQTPLVPNQKSSLEESFGIASKMGLSRPLKDGVLFAYASSAFDPPAESDLVVPSTEFKKEAEASPVLEWKLLAAQGAWEKSFEALDRLIQKGGTLKSSTDRRLARRVFDHVLATSAVQNDPERAALLLRRYLILRYTDMALRFVGVETKVEVKPKEESLAAGKDAMPDPKSAKIAVQTPDKPAEKALEETRLTLRGAMAKLLSLRELEDVRSALGDDDAILSIHAATESRRLFVSAIGKKEARSAVFPGAGSDWRDPKAYAKVFSDARLSDAMPKANGRLYIVPSAELWNVPWESVPFGGKDLQKSFVLAFLPTPDSLPEYFSARAVPKVTLGHIAWGDSEATISTANPDRDVTVIPLEGDAPVATKFGKHHIVHVDSPLRLNDVEPGRSVLVAVDPEKKVGDPLLDEAAKAAAAMPEEAVSAEAKAAATKQANAITSATEEKKRAAYLNDATLKQIANADLSATTVLVFANVQRVNRDLEASLEGHDGMALLSLAAGASGVATTMVVERPLSATRQADEDEEDFQKRKAAAAGPAVDWTKFYLELGKSTPAESRRAANVEGRILGFAGVNATEEKAFAEANLESVTEDGVDALKEKAWDTAAVELRKAYYFAKLLGKTDEEEEVLGQLVSALFQKRDYTGALYFKKKDVEKRKPAPKGQPGDDRDPSDYAVALLDAGILAVRGKQFAEAEALLGTAEPILRENDELAHVGRLYEYRAINAQNQTRYDETVEHYKKSRELYVAAGNKPEATKRLVDIGNIYRVFVNDYTSALEYYEKAATEYRQQGLQAEFLPVSINRATTLISIGQLELAIGLLEREILPAIDREKQRFLAVRAMRVLADAYFRAGIYQKAQEINEAALEEAEDIEDPSQKMEMRLDSLSLRGMILAKLGQHKEAFATFRDAIQEAVKVKFRVQVAVLYNNYGFWLREYGGIDTSIDFFNVALKIDEDLKSKTAIAFDKRNLGLSIMLKGDLNRARDLLKEALKTSEELNIPYNTAYCYFGLGDVAMREEKFADAEAFFQKALTISKKGYMQDFVWRAEAGVSAALLAQEKAEEAEKRLKSAVALIEKLRAGLKSEASRNAFLSDAGVQEVYESYALVLMQKGESEKAWEIAERARSRAFIDALGTQKLAFARAESVKLIEEERTLKSAIELVERKIGQTDKAPTAALAAELKSATAKYTELLAKMHESDKQLASFVSVEAIKKAELAGVLADDTALVQYLSAKDKLVIWVIRGDRVTGKVLPVSRAELSARIRDFRLLMQNYSSTEYLGRELSEILINPVNDAIAGAKRLVVVPHQSLHFFPFAALPMGEGHLIDTFAIHYLDSATVARFVLGGKRKRLTPDSNVVALANPTPGIEVAPLAFAGREPEVISRYFDKVMAARGEAATEALVRNESARAEIVHVASHAEFKPSDPGESRLLLSPGGGQDGYLSVNEMFSMATSADLVTLSACESGLGKLTLADEIIGMNRALQYAGARTVVTSLWRISDVASAVTMKRFYRHLAEGADKAEAMRLAQKTVRKYFSHPAYWSSFKVVGDYQ